MALPEFNEFGDLPEGVYPVTLREAIARFGIGSPQRVEVTERLKRIFDLATSTGSLDRVIVFGSYVTQKEEPNDVDVILVMHEDFQRDKCMPAMDLIFDHERATNELKASVFWVKRSALLGEPLEQFVRHWQVTREQRRRGILEIRP